MIRVGRVVFVSALGVAVGAGVSNAAVVVDTCGQTFSGEGVLAADLDCTGHPGHALTIEGSGSLDLAGFTLHGGGDDGVHCADSCSVESSVPGGTITGSANEGVEAEGGLTVAGVIIKSNGALGLYTTSAITVRDSIVAKNGSAGVYGDMGARVSGSVVEENGDLGVGSLDAPSVVSDSVVRLNAKDGVSSGFSGARVIDSLVDRNGYDGVAADGGTVVIKGSELTNNGGDGVFSWEGSVVVADSIVSSNSGDGITTLGKVVVRDSSVSFNGGTGVHADMNFDDKGGRVTLVDSELTGNSMYGVYARMAVRLRRSEVTLNKYHGVYSASIHGAGAFATGNGHSSECGGSFMCADLTSEEPPRFRLKEGVSDCGTSYMAESGVPGSSWNVCTSD